MTEENTIPLEEQKNVDPYDLSHLRQSKRELSKLDIWERKLLDFSLRNTLLNLSPRRRAIQLVSFEIDKLEDHLAEGEEYMLMPRPDIEMQLDGDDKLVRSTSAGALHRLVTDGIQQHRLYTYQTETETRNVLKNIYRGARNAIEETGANSLFLAIGVLRWYELPDSETPRYAPILLLPVQMVYKKSNYYIRLREEETMLNITLVEFLKQNFDIDIPGVNPLPKDEHGIDVPHVLALLREAIKEQARWSVEEECLLGTFSFSKFLMWNDIHNHRDELVQNPIVNSLVANHLTWTPSPVEQDLRETDRQLSPSHIALPVDVDSSQMAAVIEAGKGHSFILYGPPGTGKSQTITNLIANALYQGHRVLFVAEKMAALSVVQSRLAKIGLDPFCLEMHSNKVAKKHILEQFARTLAVSQTAPKADYEAKAERIFNQRRELIDYMEALHKVDDSDGLSLYQCLVRYEAIEAEPLPEFVLYSQLDKVILQGRLDEVEEALGSHLDAVLKLVNQPSAHPLKGLDLTDNYLADNTVGRMQEAAELLARQQTQYPSLLEVKELREQLLRDCHESVFEQDAKALYDEWRSIQTKWFLPRYFARKDYLNKLRRVNRYILPGTVDAFLDRLLRYRQKHNEVEQIRRVLDEWLHIKLDVDAVPSLQQLGEAQETLHRWVSHKDDMRDWLHWCRYKRELRELGLYSATKALEDRAFSAKELSDAFFKALYKYKVEKKMASVPLLAKFEGMLFDEKVKAYKQLTQEFQLLTRQELFARLAYRLPRVSDGGSTSAELGLLNRNISNGGRGKSLRDLMDQIPTLMPLLCPCMLMSPMSVAQYLTLTHDKFDLVIFDEASQMPTSEAVGAIARGHSLIVVGDPKQMPPTTFFASASVDEEDAYIDDMESILEDCRTLSFPSLQLSWHYRSRHESLIAFSNNEYYDGSLITFPSTDDQQTKVSLTPVEGFYDKGGKRSNKAEAEAIVEEVVRRLGDEQMRGHSLGVIAFSVVQQSLIEDLLQERLDGDARLREWADSMYEPIFVKNLENVQGDERDVILFSIGYGPNQEGAVSMNFGPLNNAGGERRLNVAVSRAREEMIVYATLKSSQIDLRRTKARGVEGLKHFLEYAESQTLAKSGGVNAADVDSVIAQHIAEAIRQHGYVATTSVGRSRFKVDVAVSRPSSPDVYVLGILLDGENYRDTQTTRDREIVQPSVLGGLGWQVMRVWSPDWYNNPERVLQRILDIMNNNT